MFSLLFSKPTERVKALPKPVKSFDVLPSGTFVKIYENGKVELSEGKKTYIINPKNYEKEPLRNRYTKYR
jgi:hypothetical protein